MSEVITLQAVSKMKHFARSLQPQLPIIVHPEWFDGMPEEKLKGLDVEWISIDELIDRYGRPTGWASIEGEFRFIESPPDSEEDQKPGQNRGPVKHTGKGKTKRF